MSTFAFFFDLCCPILEKQTLSVKHYHLLLKTPLLTFDANADFTCEQGSNQMILRILTLIVS